MRNGYPLVELHRHLDGSLRLETILDLGRQHGLSLPANDAEGLRPWVQVTDPKPDLLSFLAKFEILCQVMVDEDAIRRVARENVEDAHREGIDHIELRFSPYFMGERHGLDPTAVTEAVCDGVEEARGRLPISVGLIGILSRTYGPEIAWKELKALLTCRDRLVALDLAGDEAGFPGELFVEHFRHGRQAGLRLIAHAGEARGADSVRQAVLELGAERIGHGIRAIDDPATLDLLAERGIPLEVCPTSNVQTSTVPSYREHPLPAFLERGLRVTLNTDDPSISGIDLAHEYRVAEEEIGLGEADLRRLQENGLSAAFLSPEERREICARAGVAVTPS